MHNATQPRWELWLPSMDSCAFNSQQGTPSVSVRPQIGAVNGKARSASRSHGTDASCCVAYVLSLRDAEPPRLCCHCNAAG